MPVTLFGGAQWKVEVKGLREAQKKTDQDIRNLRGGPVLRAFRDCALYVVKTAREEASVDRGLWRASIHPFVETSSIMGKQTIVAGAGSNLQYGPFIDLDTKPHWPPLMPLVAWVHRKGLAGTYSTKTHKRSKSGGAMSQFVEDVAVARAIQRKIAKYGTKGDHALEKGLEQNYDKIIARLKKGVADALTP